MDEVNGDETMMQKSCGDRQRWRASEMERERERGRQEMAETHLKITEMISKKQQNTIYTYKMIANDFYGPFFSTMYYLIKKKHTTTTTTTMQVQQQQQ